MTHHTLLQHRLFCCASLIIFTLSFTSLAYAAPQRNFVSAQRGSDANTANGCSITLPCRNFNAAIGVVSWAARWWPWIQEATTQPLFVKR